MAQNPQKEARIVCHALLKAAFHDLGVRANNILADVRHDAGPLPDSPREILNGCREIYFDTRSFHRVKKCFPYPDMPKEIEDLANLLVEIERDWEKVVNLLGVIAEDRDRSTKQSWLGRFWQRLIFHVRRVGRITVVEPAAEKSIPEGSAGIVEILESIVHKYNQGFTRICRLIEGGH